MPTAGGSGAGGFDSFLEDLTNQCCAVSIGNVNYTAMSSSFDEQQQQQQQQQQQRHQDNDPNPAASAVGGDDDGDDLDAALANMDIDKDFNLSFPEDGDDDLDGLHDDPNDPSVSTAPPLPTAAGASMDWRRKQELWKQRLERDEVFSPHYRPSPSEQKELDALSSQLNAKSMFSSEPLLNQILSESHSIVLQRGPIRWVQHEDDNNNANNNNNNNITNQWELVLLTHGFVLIKPAGASFSLDKLLSLGRTYEVCEMYASVEWVRDLWQIGPNHYSIKTQGREWHFMTETEQDKGFWLAGWERVLLQNRQRQKQRQRRTASQEEETTTTTNPKMMMNDTNTLGWQHALVQTSLFTAAVTGQAFFSPHHWEQKDTLDPYNGLGPIHYAALRTNVHIIQHLVQEGKANVELKDSEGRTAMYYAQRDNLQPSVMVLRDLGAKNSELLETEKHGELAQEAREWEHERTERQRRRKQEQDEEEMKKVLARGSTAQQPPHHQQQQQQQGIQRGPSKRRSFLGVPIPSSLGLEEETVHYRQQQVASADEGKSLAQQAHATMSNTINLLLDRGDKINQLDDKAGELETNAAEYASLASQLKQKLQRQNRNPFARG